MFSFIKEEVITEIEWAIVENRDSLSKYYGRDISNKEAFYFTVDVDAREIFLKHVKENFGKRVARLHAKSKEIPVLQDWLEKIKQDRNIKD